MSGLIGKEFTWIQGGNSEGDHYCTGTVIGVVKKGESLFKKFPQNKFDWAYYVVDRSVRYDRAILKNSRYDSSNRKSIQYFIVMVNKLSQPRYMEIRTNDDASLRIEYESSTHRKNRKYLISPHGRGV